MCPNEFPSIMKGLSRGRRVHRGHRDMPPARPPVVTEAPLSPRRALRRGEDPPPPARQRPGRSASPTFYLRSTSVRGQPRCLGRPRRPPDGAVAAESQGRRRPQGARPETLRGAVWRWSHANPRVVEDRPAGFSEDDGQVRQVRLSREVRPGGFPVVCSLHAI